MIFLNVYLKSSLIMGLISFVLSIASLFISSFNAPNIVTRIFIHLETLGHFSTSEKYAFLIISIIVNVVFHELGHSIAAWYHKVPILDFGLNLFSSFVYVELDKNILKRKTPLEKLEIVCSGISNNWILVFISSFILNLFKPENISDCFSGDQICSLESYYYFGVIFFSVSLSMAIYNMLPIFRLDGHVLLVTILQYFSTKSFMLLSQSFIIYFMESLVYCGIFNQLIRHVFR